MGARRAAISLPADIQNSSGPFSRREKLLFHFSVFLLGSWNLLMINLARSPQHLWFWPWVAAWGLALIVHLSWVLLRRPSAVPPRTRAPQYFRGGG